MTDVYTQIPYDEFTSRVMKSLIPSIRIHVQGEAIDRVVNYEVKSTPDSDYASCPFDGSTQDGLAYDLTVAQPEGLTLTIAKVAALAPVANTPYLATTAVGGIGVASHCKIWSKAGYVPESVTVDTLDPDGAPTPLEFTMEGGTLNWQESGELQVATLSFDPRVMGEVHVEGYKFTFTPGGEATELHIYKILLLQEIEYGTPTTVAEQAAASVNGPCPPMQFTEDPTDSKTLEKMTGTMGETLSNTQCDSLFQNIFKTYAAGKLDNVTTGDFDSEVEARADARVAGNVGWGGVETEAEMSTEARAKVKASVTNDLKTEMQAGMSNDTKSRARGCEAVTAMSQLMANAQKEATCVMTTLNTSMEASVTSTQSINISVGNVTGSSITGTNTSTFNVVVNFANSNEIDSALTSIMSTMMDSVLDVKNGMTAEGAFAPTVGAKVFGANASTSIAEANRTFCNTVVTEQLVALRLGQDITFSAQDITDSEIVLTNDSSIELIAGMMVQNVVKQIMQSDMMASQMSTWRSDNSAASEGLTFDFMSMLLAPLIGVLGIGLFFVVGGPVLLKKMASKHLAFVAALILVGSIVGMVVSQNIGGYVVSGLGIVVGLYLGYTAWRLSKVMSERSTVMPMMIPAAPEESVGVEPRSRRTSTVPRRKNPRART